MSFNPEWDIVYLYRGGSYQYCVIKKPEPLPGEKELMVQEGCTVEEDGRWYYWRYDKPQPYKKWMANEDWIDNRSKDPNKVVECRLNRGKTGVIPAPVFAPRRDNNWQGLNPRIVPMYLTEEMLGDFRLAHLQLCEELQEGKPLKK